MLPARSRVKTNASIDKNNAINLEDRINDVQDSNIKIEGEIHITFTMQYQNVKRFLHINKNHFALLYNTHAKFTLVQYYF